MLCDYCNIGVIAFEICVISSNQLLYHNYIETVCMHDFITTYIETSCLSLQDDFIVSPSVPLKYLAMLCNSYTVTVHMI